MSKRVKGIIYAIVSATSFGFLPFFIIPLVGSGLSEESVLFYRFMVSAVMMGLVGLIQRKSFRITWKNAKALIFLGSLSAATAFGLIFSYGYIPSGMSTTIHFLYPVLVSLIMVMFYGQGKSPWLVVSALMAMFGVAIMSWNNPSGDVSGLGISYALSTVITYALYIVGVNKTSARKIEAVPLTFYILLVGAVIFGVYALVNGGIGAVTSVSAGVNIVLLAAICTVLSNLMLVMAVKNAGSTITAILGSSEPMTAVLLGVLCFGEFFSFETFIGFAFILASVALIVTKVDKEN